MTCSNAAHIAARYSAVGKPIRCAHCGNDVFLAGQMPLSQLGLQYQGGDANTQAHFFLACIDCGRVECFFKPPQRTGDASIPHGAAGVQMVGHRKAVGGLWELMGKLQFDFLLSQGLKPHHFLLDIACGSLRAGIHFIAYLDAAHYLGIEKEQSLLQAGITHELGEELLGAKTPGFVISDSFEFHKFSTRVDYALAQSLFTHLPPANIKDCFTKLRAVIADSGIFFATYFECTEHYQNPNQAHDHARFEYTRDQMLDFGTSTGWRAHYIGDWNHPRNQMVVKYQPA